MFLLRGRGQRLTSSISGAGNIMTELPEVK